MNGHGRGERYAWEGVVIYIQFFRAFEGLSVYSECFPFECLWIYNKK